MNDTQALEGFFNELRQSITRLDDQLSHFFEQFELSYTTARSARAATTPHLNVLRVFGLEFAELRHSAVLAWFLNPDAEHERGNLFANALLKLCGADPTTSANYSVDCERFGRVDVACLARGDFGVFIENKVCHHERPNQVRDMVDQLVKACEARSIPRERRIAVFLTDHGQPPGTGLSCDIPGFQIVNQKPLARVTVFESFRDALDGNSLKSPLLIGFLDSYLTAIRSIRSSLT